MKYIEKPTLQSENDCDECCFALSCINPCRLSKGKHYEETR